MEFALFDAGRDSLETITKVLHRAYAQLATAGMNYVAATQSVEMTRLRIEHATCCWVARSAEAVVGTLAYYSQLRETNVPPRYALQDVGLFAQIAVEPALQRSGIGSALLLLAERRAGADGKTELCCDTAMDATALRTYYARRGYRPVGTHRWPHAVYTSVILSKNLIPA